MATLNLGRIKPVFRGAYAGGTAYVVDDIVTSGNETFICILASTGNATSNATYWTKLAAKGTDGTDVGTTITTSGDILYRDGSGLQRLAKGTASQTLQMDGSAAFPTWATVTPPSSDFVQIKQTVVTSGTPATIDFVHGTGGVVIDSTYQTYCLIVKAVPVSAGVPGCIRLSDDTGSTFESSGYITTAYRRYYSGGQGGGSNASYILYPEGGSANTKAQGQFSCTAWFGDMADSTTMTSCWGLATLTDGATSQNNANFFAGNVTTVNNHDGIQFLFGSGNVQFATATLYGLK